MRRPLPGYRRTPAQRRHTFIAEWREFRGMTQEQLADRLETTKATISRIEKRDLPYTQDFLEACADALGVHASLLITRPPVEADRFPVSPAGKPARITRRQ